MKNLAHTKDGKTFTNEDECQELKDHLLKTAAYAKAKAAAFDASEAAEIIGLLHDVGKYSDDFQQRIRGKRKSPAPHALAGAQVLIDRYGEMAKLYGIVIASHHTGLSNWGSEVAKDDDTYCGKLNRYEKAPLPFDDDISLPAELMSKALKWQRNGQKQQLQQIQAFQIAMHLRMLFSVLVDSDFTDTEEFCRDVERMARYPGMEEMYTMLMRHMPENDGKRINNIRAKVLENCLLAAEKAQGLFSLTVPTGGGKTLSSLAFALKHAMQHGLRRVIYVIPYTSIIEQNAAVLREKLGWENILEHHAGIESEGGDFRARWAAENWDIPVVVTTNVQFFESLFASKATKARKIHNIARSVVIFDEAQMLPAEFLTPCMKAISELVENYKVTAVLCSATQPLVQKYAYGNIETVEIADSPEYLAEQLRRVDFRYVGKKTDEDIVNELETLTSALLVVNSRRHAFALYSLAKDKTAADALFYLSTLLTPAHRTKKIAQIKERLRHKLPVKVISTQMIEAGVDIDFPVVYRSMAGIDSIIQAGGRANREGRLENPDGSLRMGEVLIFEAVSESGKIPRSLQATASIGREVIDSLGNDAFGLTGINKYFTLLHQHLGQGNGMDKREIMCEYGFDRGKINKMNFANVAKKFKLIDDNHSHGIVINDNPETDTLIKAIRSGDYGKQTLRKLQRQTVSIYDFEFRRLADENAIQTIAAGIHILVTPAYYSEDMGLDIFSVDNKNGEAYTI